MEHEHLLLNLHWILSKNTAPTTPVMNAIQFLTKICSQVPRSRAFLRDNLGLASTLTNLLVSLGVNSSSKSSKVLELLRFVSHGISIIRQESYLEKLIVQLLRLLKSTFHLHWICIRRLVGSTDQACSSGFYFRIAWKSTERPCFLPNHSLSFLQGLRSLKNWLLQKLSMKSLDQKF